MDWFKIRAGFRHVEAPGQSLCGDPVDCSTSFFVDLSIFFNKALNASDATLNVYSLYIYLNERWFKLRFLLGGGGLKCGGLWAGALFTPLRNPALRKIIYSFGGASIGEFSMVNDLQWLALMMHQVFYDIGLILLITVPLLDSICSLTAVILPRWLRLGVFSASLSLRTSRYFWPGRW